MKPVRVAIDPIVLPDTAEVKFVFKTLLRIAGLPWEFCSISDSSENRRIDIYYGPPRGGISPRIRIEACGRPFSEIDRLEPELLRHSEGLPFLEFGPPSMEPVHRFGDEVVTFSNDIVFGSYWLLIGAPEPYYPRNSVDTLDLSGSFFLRQSLQTTPVVSIYGAFLRRIFRKWAYEPLASPVAGSFAFTHDVDYPEMIRWIECLRLAASRGWKALPSIAGVVRGTNHFWTFSEWVQWEKRLGTRPAFYFMARQGSLLQYALGTPDDFYDIRTTKFRELFRYLRNEGCEIGLHASYNAWRSAETFRREKDLLEETAGVAVKGNRHHYWHLDPRAPHETLALHEQAGLLYDSSLGLECYPGFRRGICHPFRPYHPGLRRELDVVQLPPAWMDDHFDRRILQNRIAGPVEYAKSLVRQSADTGGIVVVDYHSRGMNTDFYPRYGPWIRDFVEKHLDSGLTFRTAGEIAHDYAAYEQILESRSRDLAVLPQPVLSGSFEISAMAADDVKAVARLHYGLFGDPKIHGHSIATFGADFLERTFYKLNLDNPHFFCDVARYRGRAIGFSVYCTRKSEVFRHMLRRNFRDITAGCFRLLGRKPNAILGLLKNLRYAGGERLPGTERVDGWWMVAGVHPDYRTGDFEARIGVRVASRLFDNMEKTMREHGCAAWYGVVRPDNPAIKKFLERREAVLLGTAPAQGLQMEYYVKTLETTAALNRADAVQEQPLNAALPAPRLASFK